MNINELVTDKNKMLYDDVKSALKILLRKNAKDDSWGAYINNNTLIIEYGSIINKEECFVHELLHAKCQLDGYKRIKWSISNKDINGYMSILGTAIDNEFQHHKMFKNFTNMGYNPSNFYGYFDSKTRNHILSYLENPDKHIFMIITQYLTLTSAGSEIIFDDLDILKDKFRKITGGSSSKILDCIDYEIDIWKHGNEFDVSKPLKAIFSIIGGAQYTYFSYSEEENLKYGFFTGLPFDADFSNGIVTIKCSS